MSGAGVRVDRIGVLLHHTGPDKPDRVEPRDEANVPGYAASAEAPPHRAGAAAAERSTPRVETVDNHGGPTSSSSIRGSIMLRLNMNDDGMDA